LGALGASTAVTAQRRPSAYGIFTAAYGVAWFLGSVIIGKLYDVSLVKMIVFSVVVQLAAIPIFFVVRSRAKKPLI